MALRTRVISVVWSFSEATFFFFVPDIWLTRIAVQDFREATLNAAIALAGALLGGVVMYVLSGLYFAEIERLLMHVPAISAAMVADTGTEMRGDHPLLSIVLAGFSGVPYKIYAAWAGQLGLSVPLFLLASALARTARFVAVILAACLLKSILRRHLGPTALLWAHAILWAVFYCFYFYRMGV